MTRCRMVTLWWGLVVRVLRCCFGLNMVVFVIGVVDLMVCCSVLIMTVVCTAGWANGQLGLCPATSGGLGSSLQLLIAGAVVHPRSLTGHQV